MREAKVIGPAGTAVVRDTRTWHDDTANHGDRRIMVGWAYFAPSYRGALKGGGKRRGRGRDRSGASRRSAAQERDAADAEHVVPLAERLGCLHRVGLATARILGG